MTYSFGAEFKGKDKKEYLQKLSELDNGDYQRFLLSMERESKIGLINGLVEQDEDLLLLFKPDDLVRPMELLMKPDKVKMMSELDTEFIIPMIEELPLDLTSILLTQIDPKDFSEVLAEDFKDILSSVVLFSNS